MSYIQKVIGFLVLLLLTSCGGGSSSSGGAAASDPNGFDALLGPTFESERCQNCHDFDNNIFGEVHAQTGRSDRDCAECHFTPDWEAPFQSFSFANLSNFEICSAIKNKTDNDLDRLRESLLDSTLAQWAIVDAAVPVVDADENYIGASSRPEAAPGSLAQFQVLVDQWLAGGAICD